MKTRDKALDKLADHFYGILFDKEKFCRRMRRWARSKAPRQDKHSLPGAWFNAGVNAYKDKFR